MSAIEHDQLSLPVMTFELANGHRVQIRCGSFRHKPTNDEKREGRFPPAYGAVRVYCQGDVLPVRLRTYFEFRPGHDYELRYLPVLWGMLDVMLAESAHLVFDDADQFLDRLVELFKEADADEQAVDRPHTDDPEDPVLEGYDPSDDSFYNDQD